MVGSYNRRKLNKMEHSKSQRAILHLPLMKDSRNNGTYSLKQLSEVITHSMPEEEGKTKRKITRTRLGGSSMKEDVIPLI